MAFRFHQSQDRTFVDSLVPTSGLSTIPSDLQNDWKSLYWPDVLIDGTALLLRSLVNLPQNGVSIFVILTLELSEPYTCLSTS